MENNVNKCKNTKTFVSKNTKKCSFYSCFSQNNILILLRKNSVFRKEGGHLCLGSGKVRMGLKEKRFRPYKSPPVPCWSPTGRKEWF
jgi:hypothetical protein